MDLPVPARESVDAHREAVERVLDWLAQAASAQPQASPATFAQIAETLTGVVRSALDDAKLLEERLSYFEHVNKALNDKAPFRALGRVRGYRQSYAAASSSGSNPTASRASR